MSGSITLNLPSARRVVAIIAALTGFVALLLLGIAIGYRLLAKDPISVLATPGAVQQVGVSSGAVYVGRIVGAGDDYLRIADPATIRQGNAASDASPGAQLVVEALTVEPYDAEGDLVIPITSVQWVTTVRPGSGLETAYRQATGTVPGASTAPASSSSP